MAAALLVLMAAIGVSPAGNWPAFRGSGDSVTAAKNLPLSWSDDENIAWSVDLKGYGQSSPIIWGSRVFVTSTDGPSKGTAILACYDLAGGQQKWQRKFDTSSRVKVTDYVSRSAPTPAADADRVYAFFESGDLRAFSHDGEPIWQRSLTKDYGDFKGNHGLGSSLALTDKAVIVLVDHAGPSYLLAVDKTTGKNIWKIDRPDRVSWCSPIVAGEGGEAQVLVSSNGSVESFNATTGKQSWKITGIEGNTVASATASKDAIIVGSSASGFNLAIRPGGEGDVTDSHVAWRTKDATSSFASPLVHRGHVYFTNRGGVAFCVNLKTGEPKWQHRLGESCWASPVGANDRVYFFTRYGTTTVAAAGGELKIVAENTLTSMGRVYGVAVVDGAIIVREGSRLVRIGSSKTE